MPQIVSTPTSSSGGYVTVDQKMPENVSIVNIKRAL
jgi:hypothetical protein